MKLNGNQKELLKVMWEQGHPASMIAEFIGGTTRSAVLGYAHRMQLSARRGEDRSPVISNMMWCARTSRTKRLVARQSSGLRMQVAPSGAEPAGDGAGARLPPRHVGVVLPPAA